MSGNDTFGYDFRNDEPWRMFRIMGEFVTGVEDLAPVRPAVCIFGSARTEPGTPYYEAGVDVAAKLAEKGFNIITGGGPGIMEAANKGAKEASKGESIGLNIELPFEQHPNPYITKMLTFRYFFVRKVMFLKYSCAVVVLPGGFGTLDEFFEVITLIQTKKILPIPVYLMGKEYWGGLVDWLREKMLGEGNICPQDMDLFTLTDDDDEVVNGIIENCGHAAAMGAGMVPPGDGM